MRTKPCKNSFFLFIVLIMVITSGFCCAFGEDFVLEGIYEAAADLPKIQFLFRREPNGPPLGVQGEYLPNYGFLDTGASGILISRLTVDNMGLTIEHEAQYADVGVAGYEYFDVSEPLYIGTIDYNAADPYDTSQYLMNDQWHFQVNQVDPEIPFDLLGMPVMAGKVMTVNTTFPYGMGLPFLSANILEADDPLIPLSDIDVKIRYEKYIVPEHPENVPPLPVLAYNPVIDNIVADYNGISSTGSWLLDTGGSISLMSVEQGMKLGLTDELGEAIIPTDFNATISGIGGEVILPGFEIDELSVPTLNGFDIVYKNARLCVHDIGYIDFPSEDIVILDGVFGINFLSASYRLSADPLGGDDGFINDTPFETLIINNKEGILELDVKDIYPVPTCGDANHPYPVGDISNDCRVGFSDLELFCQNWMAANCNEDYSYCNGADIDQVDGVDLEDYTLLANNWGTSLFYTSCGSDDMPIPAGDLDYDCKVDIFDIEILADEWLNDCDWLNYNCRGADIIKDGITNFHDLASMLNNMDN